MTKEQRQFASDHHDLIYAFLQKKELSISDYYDVAALGFLQAVQRYLTQPRLRRYAFTTIAWRAMDRDVAAACRAEIRRKNAERQYLDDSRVWYPDIREEAESRLILHETFNNASPEQYRTAKLRAQGFSVKETARIQGIQVKQAHRLLGELRKNCTRLYI